MLAGSALDAAGPGRMLSMQSIIIVSAFLRVASLEPLEAARYAAKLEGPGYIRLTARLRSVCWRESRCSRIGLHKRDLHAADLMYKKAAKVKWLPGCHQGKDPSRFGVRGAWGLSVSYNVRYTPLPCDTEPEAFDIPVLSALVAARKMMKADRMGVRARVLWGGSKKCAARNKRTGRDDCVKPRT